MTDPALTAGIFDVDGVLLASPHERAWREALAVSAAMDQGEPMTLHVHGTPHELRRDKAVEVGA